jgi:4-amino-4-deoxy-L-arabinose transferase-like glycosyltransferase
MNTQEIRDDLAPGSPQRRTHLLDLLLVLCFCVAFLGYALGRFVPLSDHEGLVAVTAEGAYRDGHWIVPYFNGQIRLQKTPLMYWAVAGLACAFGQINEFVIRLPSVISATAVALMLTFLAARMFNRVTGIVTGLATGGCAGILWQSHRGTADMLMTAFVTATMVCLWLGLEALREGRHHRRWFILGYVAFAFGMLAKGPVPAPVVGLPIAIYLAWLALATHLASSRRTEDHMSVLQTLRHAAISFFRFLGRIQLKSVLPTFRRSTVSLFRLMGRMQLHWGVLITLLIVGGWAAAVMLSVDNAMDRWREEYVARFFGQFGTNRPWHYYIPQIFLLVLPWSVFLPIAMVLPFRKEAVNRRRELVYLFLWLVPNFIFFSISEGKRAHYILPILPPAIMLSVAGMMYCLERWGTFRKVMLASLLAVVVTAGAAVWGYFLIRKDFPQAMTAFYIFVGIILSMEVLAAIVYLRWGTLSMGTVIALGAGLCFAVAWPMYPEVADPNRDPISAARRITAKVGADAEIYFIGRANAELVFYYGRNMPQIPDNQDITLYLAAGKSTGAALALEQKTIDTVFDLLRRPGRRYFVSSEERFVLAKGHANQQGVKIEEILRIPRYFSESQGKGLVFFGNVPEESSPTPATQTATFSANSKN